MLSQKSVETSSYDSEWLDQRIALEVILERIFMFCPEDMTVVTEG
jgi:hypothetical protein